MRRRNLILRNREAVLSMQGNLPSPIPWALMNICPVEKLV
jgi:hypothetical protein